MFEADDDSHNKLRFIKQIEILLNSPSRSVLTVECNWRNIIISSPSQDYVISVSCQIRPIWLVSAGHVTGWGAVIGCNYQGSYDWWGLESEWGVELGDLLENRAHTDIILILSSVLSLCSFQQNLYLFVQYICLHGWWIREMNGMVTWKYQATQWLSLIPATSLWNSQCKHKILHLIRIIR